MEPDVVHKTAEVIAKNGADPVLFATVVFVLITFLGLVGWIIKNAETRAKDVMDDYQRRMSEQTQSARDELKEQRHSHESSLNKLSESFERSLERVVVTNEANVNKIVDRMDRMDTRLVHVEMRLPPLIQQEINIKEEKK